MKSYWSPEAQTETALRILLRSNPLVIGYHHAKKNGELDAVVKVDFLIFLANRLALPIQVKGNRQGLLKHIRQHPHIWGLLVNKEDTPQDTALEIEKLIQRILNKPKKIRVRPRQTPT